MSRRYDDRFYLVEGGELDIYESMVWRCSRPITPFSNRDGEEYNKQRQRFEEFKKEIRRRPARQQMVPDDVWKPGKEYVWRWAMEGTVYTDLNLSCRYMLWRAIYCDWCKAFAHRNFKRYFGGWVHGDLDDFGSLCPKCTIIDYKAQHEDHYG